MSLLPLEMLAPVVSLGKSAGTAAAAVGTGFAGMLKNAMQQATAASNDSAKGDAGSQSTGSASPVDSGPSSAAIGELRKQTDEKIEAFQQQLLQLLAANGIDVSSGVHLQLDDFGQVRVAGDHPRKHAIETVLASYSELESQFQEIAARSDALKSFDESKLGLLPVASESRFDLFVSITKTSAGFSPTAV
ncbi:MAG: hypothetical protein AB7O26_13885 [Planctomycetaceae bacterium]